MISGYRATEDVAAANYSSEFQLVAVVSPVFLDRNYRTPSKRRPQTHQICAICSQGPGLPQWRGRRHGHRPLYGGGGAAVTRPNEGVAAWAANATCPTACGRTVTRQHQIGAFAAVRVVHIRYADGPARVLPLNYTCGTRSGTLAIMAETGVFPPWGEGDGDS
ncbi:hypothetical protein MAPG_06154 [Magnaporthiopsis poae ATCC 64411]|uniref:Uncharacterized protein n=1 Tax=Magnaporthiopsis poae (strain ATCC 64411 / 73-15) TaxID=644358 RepID=A0A0C4E1A0_MAGP6|nr:hypothetical protein MAPG_06154 [Magnaporthiopsis poae ATCC 64411]